jgi:hypothetical protein
MIPSSDIYAQIADLRARIDRETRYREAREAHKAKEAEYELIRAIVSFSFLFIVLFILGGIIGNTDLLKSIALGILAPAKEFAAGILAHLSATCRPVLETNFPSFFTQ